MTNALLLIVCTACGMQNTEAEGFKERLAEHHRAIRSLYVEFESWHGVEKADKWLYSQVAAKECKRFVSKEMLGVGYEHRDVETQHAFYDGQRFDVWFPVDKVYETSERFAIYPYIAKVHNKAIFEMLGWWPPGDTKRPEHDPETSPYWQEILAHPRLDISREREVVEGHSCVVLEIPGSEKLWVHAEYLVPVQRILWDRKDQAPLLTSKAFDFKEVSDEVWLPFGFRREFHKEERVSTHAIKRYVVNAVPDEIFVWQPVPGTIVKNRDDDSWRQIPGGLDHILQVCERVDKELATARRNTPDDTNPLSLLAFAAVIVASAIAFLSRPRRRLGD